MRVRTLSGRPPDEHEQRRRPLEHLTASSTFWPTPIVGSFGPITFSTARLHHGRVAVDRLHQVELVDRPDTSAAANGGVFLHTGSWLTPLARIRSIGLADRAGPG